MLRRAIPGDERLLGGLAVKLWESHSKEELIKELLPMLNSGRAALYPASQHETPIGFAQCQLRRDYVEGTSSSPVGYLEGIFVEESHRHKHIAAKLLAACENWARGTGCLEFASDCEWNNTDSLSFHLKTGFQEANRIICYQKKL